MMLNRPLSKQSYTLTKTASYIGCAVQAITINFTPMLFVAFMSELSLSVEELSVLVALTFAVQFLIDFISVFLVRRVSYRTLVLLAHAFSCVGFLLMRYCPLLWIRLRGCL